MFDHVCNSKPKPFSLAPYVLYFSDTDAEHEKGIKPLRETAGFPRFLVNVILQKLNQVSIFQFKIFTFNSYFLLKSYYLADSENACGVTRTPEPNPEYLSRFRFIDLDPAAVFVPVFVPVVYFFDTKYLCCFLTADS